ncbi:MAG TPA: OsmC family protein [Vicinamibacterales bacterium]|jgi:organic hydroperoxide reductase OsmC/OhrA
MKPLPHHYDVRLTGGPSGYARLETTGVPELTSAPPLEFDGPGDAWSPEHLLLASVQTCFLFTLRAVARASKLEFASLELAATGVVDRSGGITRFTEITLRPKIGVPPGTDRGRVLHALAKSEKACLVSASLSTPIHLAPEIVDAESADRDAGRKM